MQGEPKKAPFMLRPEGPVRSWPREKLGEVEGGGERWREVGGGGGGSGKGNCTCKGLRMEIAGREHGDCKQLKTGRDEAQWGKADIPKSFKEGNDMITFTCFKKALELLGGKLFGTEGQEPNLNVPLC